MHKGPGIRVRRIILVFSPIQTLLATRITLLNAAAQHAVHKTTQAGNPQINDGISSLIAANCRYNGVCSHFCEGIRGPLDPVRNHGFDKY